MLDAGIKPHISEFGSQSSVRNSPFEYGYIFLTRRSLDGKLAMGVPEEAIPDRMTMLLMMTRWASLTMMKDELGSIEPAKFADLVVLDAHLMDVPLEELPQIKPIMTMVHGKIVFEDATSFKFLASAPTSTAGYNHLYANTPNGGGTGLYFVNTTTSDELVSKTKATILALIFS
jgi:hypothetical protein